MIYGPADFESGIKMNCRIVVVVFAGLLLCGCTIPSWDQMTTYAGLRSAEQAAPPQAAPAEAEAATTSPSVTQASRSDSWCQQMAKADSVDAASNGFDAATQRRRAEASYRQCVASSGSAAR